jgi:hypothetical protein
MTKWNIWRDIIIAVSIVFGIGIISAILALRDLREPSVSQKPEHDILLKTVEYDGHWFIIKQYYSNVLLHHPGCPKCKEKIK